MAKLDELFEEFEAQEALFREFEAQEDAKNKKIVAEQIYPETLEGKYLQPIYDVAAPVVKGLSVLEKPLSTAMAAGKTIGRGLNELAGATSEGMSSVIEPLKQEALSGIFPAPENSISSGLRDVGIGTTPLLEGALPTSVRAQFPKASAVVEGMAPVDLVDMGASGVYGSKLPGMAGSQLDDMKIADREIAKNALVRGSQRDVNFVGDLQYQGKMNSLATKILESPSIRKNLADPKNMVQYLQGLTDEITDPITKIRKKVVIVPGKLDEVGNALSEKIKKNKVIFNSNEFKDNVVNSLLDESDQIGSGIDLKRDQLIKEVDKYVKNTDVSGRSLEDIVKIKRGAADRIFKMKQVNFANVENPTFAEQVAQKIWSEADKQIEQIAIETGDFDLLGLNNEFSDLSKIRELYANKDIAKKYIPSMIEDLIPAAAIGTAAAVATGSPYAGLVIGGGYPMARSGVSGFSKDLPAMALNSRLNYIEPSLRAASLLKPGVTTGAMMMTQFPRETDKIMAMKDEFLTSIARETKTPQGETLFKEIVNIMNTNPGQIKSLLPVIMKAYPQIFVSDPYDRIDGEITNPILKQKAIEKIINDQPSALEGAKQMQLLINGNKYYGE